MGKYQFVGVDVDKCTGCRVCEYVCSMEHCGVFNPTRSRIHVVRVYPHTNAAFNCRMCDDAPCIPACPRKGAIVQDPETGIIRVDDVLCDVSGCNSCVRACEYGSIVLEGGKPRICNLCEGRKGGPACIEWCPEGALELTTDDSLSQKMPAGFVQTSEQDPATGEEH